MRKIVYAISTLSGTIIGVGLFSLPYVTSKVGFWIMLGYFAILSIVVIVVHLFFGELALRTPDFKRLPGFAKVYLGNWGEKIALVSTILGLFGALLAYLIVGGEFTTYLLSPVLGGSNYLYVLLYFALGSIIIFFGIKAIGKVEFWGLIGFFVILILIFFRAKGLIRIENLFLIENWKLPPPWRGPAVAGKIENLFLPYGVILFSLWGASLIPEAEEMLGDKKILLKKLIPIAILIPLFIYLFFIYLILGITGIQTTESALTGLKNVLGDGIVTLGLLFGILTTFTSFITLGLTLKKVFWYDLKIPRNLAWLIACFTPLILYFLGMQSFIAVISFVGSVMIGVEGILILLMYRRLEAAQWRFLVYPLILIFLLGIFYEIIYFAR